MERRYDMFEDIVYKKDEYLKYKTTNILVDHDQICSVDEFLKSKGK